MAEFSPILDRARLERARQGALLVRGDSAVFRIEGLGAVPCLQGLFTNDVAKPGENSLVYGALLTPKGMIVTDGWLLRQPQGLTLVVPRRGRAAALDIFQRTLPPRLARATDATGDAEVAWLVGGQAFPALARSGVAPLPDSCGRVSTATTPAGPVAIALATEVAPFAACLVGAPAALDAVAGRLEETGVSAGTADDLEALRILAGWPALGAEIDERTLPQEVRFDAIGGVSYTKGCYTGQETVARLHFRGHTNRELRGLQWEGNAPLDGAAVTRDGREVGTVRSTLRTEDRILGLAAIRREVMVGDVVEAGGRAAQVTALPFSSEEIDA